MQTAELAVLDWIQAHLRCGFLDAVLPWISWTCNHGEIWILLAAVLLLWKKQRWTGVSLSFALILDLVCCNMISLTQRAYGSFVDCHGRVFRPNCRCQASSLSAKVLSISILLEKPF